MATPPQNEHNTNCNELRTEVKEKDNLFLILYF